MQKAYQSRKYGHRYLEKILLKTEQLTFVAIYQDKHVTSYTMYCLMPYETMIPQYRPSRERDS